jgi:hypothetical protein
VVADRHVLIVVAFAFAEKSHANASWQSKNNSKKDHGRNVDQPELKHGVKNE